MTPTLTQIRLYKMIEVYKSLSKVKLLIHKYIL